MRTQKSSPSCATRYWKGYEIGRRSWAIPPERPPKMRLTPRWMTRQLTVADFIGLIFIVPAVTLLILGGVSIFLAWSGPP